MAGPRRDRRVHALDTSGGTAAPTGFPGSDGCEVAWTRWLGDALATPLGPIGIRVCAWALVVYSVLDYRLDIGLLVISVGRSRFIWIGALAFLILLPLAVTSTNRWQLWLGPWWGRLHRLGYASALLACLHYLFRYKEIRTLPLLALALLSALLIVRITRWVRRSFAS